jgi:hypothetical protein
MVSVAFIYVKIVCNEILNEHLFWGDNFSRLLAFPISWDYPCNGYPKIAYCTEIKKCTQTRYFESKLALYTVPYLGPVSIVLF